MLPEKAEEIVNDVLDEHISGKYRLTVDRIYIRAFSLDRMVQGIWKYKTTSEELLHCQAHGFCARVLELEEDNQEDDDDEEF